MSLFNSVVVQLRWGGHNVHPCLLGWVPRLVADIVKDSTTSHVVGRNKGVVVSRGILGAEPYAHRLMESSRCRKEAVLVEGSTRGKVEASQSVLQWVLNSGDRNPENITSNEVIVCTVETSNSTVKYDQFSASQVLNLAEWGEQIFYNWVQMFKSWFTSLYEYN